MSRTDPPGMDVNGNDVVAFLVEVGVLVLLGVVGWHIGTSALARSALAIGLPVAAAVLWGLFAAPRARVRSRPLQLATKVLVLGAGVVAGFLVLPLPWAVVVAVVVLVNTCLTYVGPMARRPVS